MSELIQHNDNRATIRWKLLTTASALVLTAYSASPARAEDSDRPLLWIELGGQMEQVSGVTAPFTAPFMSIAPTPDVYNGISFVGSQRQARYAFGGEAKVTFQPENSDWNFSAGIRYGRSHANRHAHRQITYPPIPWTVFYYGTPYHTYIQSFPSAAFADTRTQNSERHAILDFSAGKDVGLGMFGNQGTSTINAGVRFASFTSHSGAVISGRPEINVHYQYQTVFYGAVTAEVPIGTFHQYTMRAHADRNFKGIGPSLSWNASAAIAGNQRDGELSVDWGINAALLFGRQKAKTDHSTRARYAKQKYEGYISSLYPPRNRDNPERSRRVSVPNIGGFAGLSLKWTNAKLSIGYRYDTFLNAMDTGIDAAKKSNVTFNGPYASISVGLGN